MELKIKKTTFYSILILILLLVVVGYTISLVSRSQDPYPVSAVNKTCVPTFSDGDGPYYYPDAPYREKLVPSNTDGETLIVSGKLYARDCQTVIPNATLDIWQADEKGVYQKDWYRGKVKTDSEGIYWFQTVIPKGYGVGTGYRPPHIHFKVIINDQEQITSEMFFPEVKGKAGFNDAYIMQTVKKTSWGKPVTYGYHHIILP